MFVNERFGNSCRLGQFAGGCVGESLPGKERQGRPHDGVPPLFRTQSLINHSIKLVIAHRLSTRTFNSLLKKAPGEGTETTAHGGSRGIVVGREPSRGEPDVFEPAVNGSTFPLDMTSM